MPNIVIRRAAAQITAALTARITELETKLADVDKELETFEARAKKAKAKIITERGWGLDVEVYEAGGVGINKLRDDVHRHAQRTENLRCALNTARAHLEFFKLASPTDTFELSMDEAGAFGVVPELSSYRLRC